ncbi:hypothetical protein KHM83_05245 [Fusibacter paucivorans]|uniref:Uncharacterized protein n=1 Tax=Fusibacter paucivorans TaxID=76009 RepID=A0ABS5PNZ8_9FIRM|nr:hypothetical protein [Fusibacter paucivorans]MBS7526071.1 hypothetical protein [Fusibacter paucivorans]
MSECKNLAGCSFVNCCEEYKKTTGVNGFINMYCRGARMEECVRLRLCDTVGKQVVPKNMMPNGYPLPGTTKEGWSKEAVSPKQYLEK